MLRILIIVISLLYITKNATANIEAIYVENSVQIKWTCIEQNNVSYFIIEKSKDGKYFKELSFIKNHSTRTGSFIEIDSKPYRNESIYRIKYVLMNGNVYYGKPLIIKENDSDILKWNEKQNIKTLLVVKDKHNNDFHFKSTVSYVNGKIYCLNNPGLAEVNIQLLLLIMMH